MVHPQSHTHTHSYFWFCETWGFKRLTNLNRGRSEPDIFVQPFPVTKLCQVFWKSSLSYVIFIPTRWPAFSSFASLTFARLFVFFLLFFLLFPPPLWKDRCCLFNLKVLIPILSGYFLPLRGWSYLLDPPPSATQSVHGKYFICGSQTAKNNILRENSSPVTEGQRGKWGCVQARISKPWLAKTGWSGYPCRPVIITHNIIYLFFLIRWISGNILIPSHC